MSERRQRLPLVAWAWAAGWALASMGLTISDVYSSPNRGLAAAYVFGFTGWTIGALGTIRHVRQQFAANVYVVTLSVAGWVVGAFAAVTAGLMWLEDWSLGFWGPIMGTALGGAIGGALTLPMRSPSSPAIVVAKSLRGAFSWGTSFLVFQVFAFYSGYILVELTVDPLVPIVGHVWAKVPGWAFPAGLGGLLAAGLASRYSESTERATAV